MGDSLLFVTQVAPYVDGPAGVHGVLDQAAVGVAQLAELQGLEPLRVDDVRTLPDAGIRNARALALFTIGETPWSASQRALILDRVRAGALSVVAIHSATDSCYGWDDYGTLVGARFDGHPWTQTFTADVLDPSHPACAHLGDAWEWHDEVYQFRDLRPDAEVLLVCATASSISTRPARARRRSATRSRGASPKARAACSRPPRSLPERVGEPDLPPPPRGRTGVDALGLTRHRGATPCASSQRSNASTFCVSSKSSWCVILPHRIVP